MEKTKKIVITEFGDLEIYVDGKNVITFTDPFDWMYGTERMQELFDMLGVDVEVIKQTNQDNG